MTASEDERLRAFARRELFRGYRGRGETAWVQAQGVSMLPTIDDGDWLFVDFARCDARPGEIVVFETAAVIVVHRVIARRRKRGSTVLVTKGDGRAHFDARVAPENVLGTVLRIRSGVDGPGRPVVVGLRARAAAAASGSVGILAPPAARLPRPLRRRAYSLARVAVRIAARP